MSYPSDFVLHFCLQDAVSLENPLFSISSDFIPNVGSIVINRDGVGYNILRIYHFVVGKRDDYMLSNSRIYIIVEKIQTPENY